MQDLEFGGYAPMICASAEAEEREYSMYKEKSGRIWMVATQDNPADNIYCGYDHDTKSEGFGGSWLKFKVVDLDREIKLQGPWHSNANSLFRATGVDVRDQYLTQVTISKGLIYKENDRFIMKDVVSFLSDDQAKRGAFERGKDLAQEFADLSESPVYFFRRSKGGSSRGWIYPEGTKNKDWTYDKESGKMVAACE